jgi:hypothetical protein
MSDAMEITPNKGMHALSPLRHVAPVVHAPGKGDGQNWPLVSAGIVVAVAATLQPRQRIFQVTTRESWTSPLNRRGRWWHQTPICGRDRQTTTNRCRERQRQAVAGKRASMITQRQWREMAWVCRGWQSGKMDERLDGRRRGNGGSGSGGSGDG